MVQSETSLTHPKQCEQRRLNDDLLQPPVRHAPPTGVERFVFDHAGLRIPKNDGSPAVQMEMIFDD